MIVNIIIKYHIFERCMYNRKIWKALAVMYATKAAAKSKLERKITMEFKLMIAGAVLYQVAGHVIANLWRMIMNI